MRAHGYTFTKRASLPIRKAISEIISRENPDDLFIHTDEAIAELLNRKGWSLEKWNVEQHRRAAGFSGWPTRLQELLSNAKVTTSNDATM